MTDYDFDIIYKVVRLTWNFKKFIYRRDFLCVREAKYFIKNKRGNYDYEIIRLNDLHVMYRTYTNDAINNCYELKELQNGF
jgi:hypothetical protein